MSLLLNIDTAVAGASIALCRDGETISLKTWAEQKDTAAWLHPAIQSLMAESDLGLNALDAIAVSGGPGSYTGLRVGMATAKGLCYALNKPLITINTLRVMAAALQPAEAALRCPMIDARRMEVFSAVYNEAGEEVVPTSSMIIDNNSFAELLQQHRIYFFGNGSEKCRPLIQHFNALFVEFVADASHLGRLSVEQFKLGIFADLAYAEPFYTKEFHSLIK